MRQLAVMLILLGALPEALRAADDWRLIEFDMRSAGCFKPPVVTARQALRSEDVLCRVRAARVLGLRGDREAVPDLKARFESDADPLVRNQAAIELVRLGERDYLEAARKVLAEIQDPVSQLSFAGQLATVGDPSGFRYVEDACRSSQVELRRMAVAVLGLFEDKTMACKVADQYLDMADDPVEDVRQSAVYGLVNLGLKRRLSPEALLRLENLAAGSSDPKMKEILGTAVAEQKRKQQEAKEKQR